MQKFKKRAPIAAGKFYASSSAELKKQIEAFSSDTQDRLKAIACVLPHAGYIYSGRVAAETVARIRVKEKIVLIGPNHTGYGKPFSLISSGVWQTPLGEVAIDSQLAEKILKFSKYLEHDELAHTYEHSLEVELPLLQYVRSDIQIVPIIIASADAGVLKQIGRDIALAIEDLKLKDSVLIVASSDLTHYESKDQAKIKDDQAIDAILKLDEDMLLEKVKKYDISMCGVNAVAAMLAGAKILGATRSQLVSYRTSGDVSQDYDSVVGYAGIIIY
jgi:AmmeMemoRadiSam system protein B